MKALVAGGCAGVHAETRGESVPTEREHAARTVGRVDVEALLRDGLREQGCTCSPKLTSWVPLTFEHTAKCKLFAALEEAEAQRPVHERNGLVPAGARGFLGRFT
jgi:hypothetical protein